MDTNERRELLEKIARLQAMGKDSRTNEHEAEIALRHAAAMMRQHQIAEAELRGIDGVSADPVWEWGERTVRQNADRQTKHATTWVGQLGLGVARFTDTLVRWDFKAGWDVEAHAAIEESTLVFSGETVDVAQAQWLMGHLIACVRVESATSPVTRRRWREDFRRAMVSRLIERMRELKHTTDREVDAQTNGRALVVRNTKLAERDRRFAPQQVSNSRRAFDSSARSAGREAGNRVSLHQSMGQRAPRALPQG